MPADMSLCERPGKGFTPWASGSGSQIEMTWPEARDLHFPLENCTHYYDGSMLVGIELWGGHVTQWCMRKPPNGWKPQPMSAEAIEHREEEIRAYFARKDAERAAEAARQTPLPFVRPKPWWEIKGKHMTQAQRRSLGARLMMQKAKTPKGEWQNWLRSVGLDPEWARKHMQLAREWVEEQRAA